MMEIMEIWTQGAKKVADISAENAPKTLKFIRSIDPIGPITKRLHWVSVIRADNQRLMQFSVTKMHSLQKRQTQVI